MKTSGRTSQRKDEEKINNNNRTEAGTMILPITEKLKYILKKHKIKLEKELNIEIDIKEDHAEIKAGAFSEYIAKDIIDALSFGFDINTALLIQNPDYMFTVINLKELVRNSRLKDVRGRIIGEKGKAKRVISELAECDMTISDNTVALIGKTENIAVASKAIQSLIRGSPHASVYAFLEKCKRRLREAEHINFEKD